MHTDYSLLDSCSKPHEYVDLAVKNGCRALSISEHGKPLNWTEKKAACDEAGIRYIHSVEIYLTESLEEKVRDNYHTILMARNAEGVRELNLLVSRSCDKQHSYYTNRISFDEFLNLSENIITTSACLASPLNKLPDDHPRYMELAKKYDFLEIQAHNCEEQIAFNRRLYELSKKIGTPLIVGTDTHNSSEYKSECRAVLLSAKRKSYGDEDTFDLTFKTYDELIEIFRKQGALPEEVFAQALDNTNLLYDMTEDFDLDTVIKYPILYGSREADSAKFEETIYAKFAEKVESGVIPAEQVPAFEEAIKEELRVFRKLQMDGFMLSMSELISWCKEQGMAIGTARGSVGGSRIAYVTDVIDLNPETWNTVFSRFCNEDRVEIGDVDIDCVESDRPAIFKYIVDRFGADKTARVASFGTIQDKGVIDDVGRHLSIKWDKAHPNSMEENPYNLRVIDRIKKEYDADPEGTKKNYPEIFYYFDGLLGTKVSQSVHPAGMVISPISLPDNFGVFDKDDDICLMLDMENVHDYTGLAKYDFLVLKTVQVIRDTCNYLGRPYPKTHEINWNDQEVWKDIIRSPYGIFQFEGGFAFESLKKFKPTSIFDMSIVTACIRPSGASYRNDLLARKPHKNPSPIIDELLKDNLGYLIYQEDTIKWLNQICGLSGSESDNVRRAIGRKQRDRLEKALPSILEGYCSKSPEPREVAELEAKEFLQILEDSASYQFGYNHSIAYCLLGYLCAYFRYYHPLEFITAFLNNAANDADIQNGTALAKERKISITQPKFSVSRSNYFFNKEKNTIAKGLGSVKYLSDTVADELYELGANRYNHFVTLLADIDQKTSLDSRQLEILIKIDFFSDFGNQRELFRIVELFEKFKRGSAKQIRKDAVNGTELEEIVKKHAKGTTKSGAESRSYILLDVMAILRESEELVRFVGMDDLDDLIKVRNFYDAMGYLGYISGKASDRRKLYITKMTPLKRKKDGKQFGYSLFTKSIGSGVESRFTVFNRVFDKQPVKAGDIIYCKSFERDGAYFTLTDYEQVF